MGRRFGMCTQIDPRYCDWTLRQDRPLMWKLECFTFFVRRMSDLNGKRIGKRMKEDDVETKLLVKMLEACYEENAGKLTKEETQATEDSNREESAMGQLG